MAGAAGVVAGLAGVAGVAGLGLAGVTDVAGGLAASRLARFVVGLVADGLSNAARSRSSSLTCLVGSLTYGTRLEMAMSSSIRSTNAFNFFS